MAFRKKIKKTSSKKVTTNRKSIRKMTSARRRHRFNFWGVARLEMSL